MKQKFSQLGLVLSREQSKKIIGGDKEKADKRVCDQCVGTRWACCATERGCCYDSYGKCCM